MLRGDAVRSGAGFLVRWLGKGETLLTISWGCGLFLRGTAFCSGTGFLVLCLVKGEIRHILQRIFVEAWVLHRGNAVRSGTGFLVLWLVKGTMLLILLAQERRCPCGGGFLCAVVGEGEVLSVWSGFFPERGLLHGGDVVRSGAGFLVLWVVRGSAAHFEVVDFRRSVGCCTGETLSVRVRVFWCCGLWKGAMLSIFWLIFPGAWVVARGRGCPFGGGFPGAVVGEGGHAAHFGLDVSGGVSCCSGERLSVRGRPSLCCAR